MYSIKSVASITGLNAETLRAWERRYAAVVPERDSKGRRLYSHEDLEHLTLLRKARLQGHAISKIAKMQNVDLQILLTANDQSSNLNNNIMYDNIIDALLQYRFDLCEDILRRALIAMDTLTYAQNFLMPILQKVGILWHDGKISVAQEHMFSNCVKRIILSLVHNMMPFSGNRAKLLFTTPPSEQHEFGILLSCLIAADQRFQCFYLGPDLPVEELSLVEKNLQPNLIVLSLSTVNTEQTTIDHLNQIADEIESNTNLWIGGAGAKFLFKQNLLPNKFQLIQDLNDFNSRLKLINQN